MLRKMSAQEQLNSFGRGGKKRCVEPWSGTLKHLRICFCSSIFFFFKPLNQLTGLTFPSFLALIGASDTTTEEERKSTWRSAPRSMVAVHLSDGGWGWGGGSKHTGQTVLMPP